MLQEAWWKIDNSGALFARVKSGETRLWNYVVEELCDGRWDWCCWTSNTTHRAYHGVAQTRANAIRAAEEMLTFQTRVKHEVWMNNVVSKRRRLLAM